MDYKLSSRKFTAPNGRTMKFWYRENTNDLDTIRGAFEEDEYKICNLKFEKDDIVIDLGAHIGGVTLLLASMRPELKIFAYEAVRENFNLLLKNVRENNIKSEITLENQAVWFYEEDEVKVYYGNNSEDGRKHKFIGSLFAKRDFYDKRVFKMAQATNLSEIFEYHYIRNCKFMKMDVEGSEYGIIKAAPKEILEMIERIHGEYHWIGVTPLKNPRSSLLKLAKGVYKDITPGKEIYPVGPFVFVKK